MGETSRTDPSSVHSRTELVCEGQLVIQQRRLIQGRNARCLGTKNYSKRLASGTLYSPPWMFQELWSFFLELALTGFCFIEIVFGALDRMEMLL